MELLIKINTDEALSLADAEELKRQGTVRNLTTGEIAAQLIREGLERLKACETGGRK